MGAVPEVTVEQINSPSELVTSLRGQRVHLSIPDELNILIVLIYRSISLLAPHSVRFSLFVLFWSQGHDQIIARLLRNRQIRFFLLL